MHVLMAMGKLKGCTQVGELVFVLLRCHNIYTRDRHILYYGPGTLVAEIKDPVDQTACSTLDLSDPIFSY